MPVPRLPNEIILLIFEHLWHQLSVREGNDELDAPHGEAVGFVYGLFTLVSKTWRHLALPCSEMGSETASDEESETRSNKEPRDDYESDEEPFDYDAEDLPAFFSKWSLEKQLEVCAASGVGLSCVDIAARMMLQGERQASL
ncbi:hypothetical protein JCM1840_002558 [Sporobolomyces johnsonii]